MTTNSELSTTELKNTKQNKNKLSKQEQNHRSRDHIEGYQWGGGGGECGKGTRNKKHNW